MIKIGIETKSYRGIETVFNLLKLNLFMLISSMSVIGIGSTVSTGFYFFKKIIGEGTDITFNNYKKIFIENFKRGILIVAPGMMIGIISVVAVQKFSLGVFFINYLKAINLIVLGTVLVFLMLQGYAEIKLKNLFVYGIKIVLENVVMIIIVNIGLLYAIEKIYKFFPGILMYFNWIVPVAIYHMIFKNRLLKNIK